MAREKRKLSPTGIYHILLRGVDELFSDKTDFAEFINILDEYFRENSAKLLGYALMKNRVHILIDEGSVGISAVIKPICTRYARYYNRVHNSKGKLFYDRYKSEPVYDDKRLAEVKSFFKSIPAEFVGGVENAPKTDTLSCIGDYYRMTDEELKEYIEAVFGCRLDDMSKEKKRVLAERIISGKRISSGRIYEIFKIKKKSPPQKKKVLKNEDKAPSENTEEKTKPSGLSVWLL